MVRSRLSVCLLSLGLNCGWTWSNLLLWCGPFSLKCPPPTYTLIKRLWEAGGTTSYSRPDSTWPGVTAMFTHPHTYRTGRVQTWCGEGWLNLHLDRALCLSVAGGFLLTSPSNVRPANTLLLFYSHKVHARAHSFGVLWLDNIRIFLKLIVRNWTQHTDLIFL